MKNPQLLIFRKKIDVIDRKIVTLIAKRQSLMPALGALKRTLALPIIQPARETSLLKERALLARDLSLDVSLIQKIFSLIIANSRKLQRKGKSDFKRR